MLYGPAMYGKESPKRRVLSILKKKESIIITSGFSCVSTEVLWIYIKKVQKFFEILVNILLATSSSDFFSHQVSISYQPTVFFSYSKLASSTNHSEPNSLKNH